MLQLLFRPRLLLAFSTVLLSITTFAGSAAALDENTRPAPTARQVLLSTNLGDILIQLEPNKAPITVANFVAYVNNGHYNGTVFHRVIPGFMAQGGGFTRQLQQKPPLSSIKNEADNGLKNRTGTIAMARTSDPHSASTQFFINLKDNGFLDHRAKNRLGWGYTVFGKVINGMDVVTSMTKIPTHARGPFRSDVPTETIEIISAKVVK